MFNIIKSDLYRIKRGKMIYIVFIVLILLSIFSAVGMSAGHMGLSNSYQDIENEEFLQQISKAKSISDFRDIMKSSGEFELDKEVIGQNVNLYYMFIIIVVIVLTTDFSTKSIKNTLSSAISRKRYYLSKVLLIIGLSTVVVLFNNYFFYFLNLTINGSKFASSLIEITKITFLQLPLIYGIISLLICIAFVFQKTSVFNTISIPFIMVIQLIVMGITNLFKLQADWFYHYEFQFALNNLVNNPTGEYMLQCILLGIGYIVFFNLIGYYVFKKSEVK